jgi:hypothetical protein
MLQFLALVNGITITIANQLNFNILGQKRHVSIFFVSEILILRGEGNEGENVPYFHLS